MGKEQRLRLGSETRERLSDLLEGRTMGELLTINDEVIARVRNLRTQKDMNEAMKYFPGEVIAFEYNGRRVTAVIDTVNQRTLLVTETGSTRKWRVGYEYARKVAENG